MTEDTRIMTDEELDRAEARIEAEMAAARARPVDPAIEAAVQAALALPYPLRVWREPEGYYACEAPDVEGCLGTGDDPAAAIADWRDAFAAWAEAVIAAGQPLPAPSEPPSADRYAGRVLVRMPRSLHRQLAEQAEREGTSLNQLAVTYVARALGAAATRTGTRA